MKKIYSFMLALFATLCVGVAHAEDPAPVTITINVDDPDAIDFLITEGYSAKRLKLVAGNNEVTINYNADWYSYEKLSATPKSGYIVDSLTVDPADAPQWEDYTAWGSGYQFFADEDCNGAKYSFHTTNLNVYRTDSVVFVIDNPSIVKVMYYGSGSISIKNDTTVVYYCSDSTITALQDLPMTVRPNWGELIYKVFQNDTELKAIQEYGDTYYAIETPKSGDTIRVLTEAPEGTVAPAIITLDSVAKVALDSVMVNDSTVALKDTILVPWGKEIALAFNIADYEVTVNNTPLGNYSNPYTAVVTDTTKIVATAKPYEKYDVTLILHDYTCIERLYVDDYIFPEQDTTILSMTSKNPRVNLYAAKDCVIDSIKWNNEVKNSTTIECKEEGVLEIWAHKVVREQKFMLYVQRDSMSYASVSSKLYHYFCDYYNPLQADYTECLFSEADDNPINASISTLSYGKAVCYLNDSILTPGSWGTIEVNLADGDVFKAYADTAEVYTVEFVLHGEATTSDVTKDRIVAVEAKKFTVLQNTEVSFKTTDTTILVNGEAVKAVEGVVTVTIVANTTIEVGAEPEPEMVSCAVANAAEDGTIVALNEVVVAYANGQNNFIQDGEGWTLLYVKDAGLKAGDRVSGIKGEIDIYNGIHEVVPSNKGEWTVTAGEAPAPAVQEAALTTADINHFIKLESVALNGALTSENKSLTGTWKGETITFYNKFNTNETFAEGLYDVVGVVSVFSNNLQVYFISAEALSEGIFDASVEVKAEKFVRDGQLIIRMNGVEYNVLGAKIQ